MAVSRITIIIVLLGASLLFAACGSGDSPEDQVRAFIKRGEVAAEARDLGAMKNLIADSYSDGHRRTKRDIIAVTARYFLTNKNIHIFTRIGELDLPAPGRAKIILYAAMAGQNISDLDALLNMQADLYRFDLQLEKKDREWQLVSADWQPAGPEDFF